VGLKLPVDIGDEGRPHILKAGLLRLRVGVPQRPQPNAPGVEGQLLSLSLAQVVEQLGGVDATVANVRRDDFHGGHHRDVDLRCERGLFMTALHFTARASRSPLGSTVIAASPTQNFLLHHKSVCTVVRRCGRFS